MDNIEQIFNKKFLDFFTQKEIEDIVESSAVVSDNSIVIDTKDCFFELSVGKESLEIFCYQDSEEKYIDKDEFMKLYKSSLSIEIQHICVDE